MANFRADRARQIMTALLDPDFDGFARTRRASFAAACGMWQLLGEAWIGWPAHSSRPSR